MRLFIGIKTGCNDYLVSLQQRLKEYGKGNFTDKANLHITLKFLGEIQPEKQKDICEAISEIKGEPLCLECLGLGTFDRSGIVFVKVGGDIRELSGLYSRLETALNKKGFDIEKRAFKPHITLVRGFKCSSDIKSVECECSGFTADEITLFESRRENGKLKYVPLFIHKLQQTIG